MIEGCFPHPESCPCEACKIRKENSGVWSALGASLDQTDNVLKELAEAKAELASLREQLQRADYIENEIASLKALVREMGQVLQRISLYSQTQEIVNPPEVKRIMEEE